MKRRLGLNHLWLVLGSGLAIGLPIYFTWHPYSPKAFVPLVLGIVGSVMMVLGAFLYALRKRVKVLRNMGRMSFWLDAHITLCILGPLLVVYHTAFAVKSPNAAVAFYAMLIVVASGVVGRYIYRHFQFSISGEQTTLREMTQEVDQLDRKIAEHFSDAKTILGTISTFFNIREKQKTRGPLGSLHLIVRLDWLEIKLKRQVGVFIRSQKKKAPSIRIQDLVLLEATLLKRISLEKKISTLEATSKLFAYWHKLHVPFIWILAFTLIVHVAAVLIF